MKGRNWKWEPKAAQRPTEGFVGMKNALMSGRPKSAQTWRQCHGGVVLQPCRNIAENVIQSACLCHSLQGPSREALPAALGTGQLPL